MNKLNPFLIFFVAAAAECRADSDDFSANSPLGDNFVVITPTKLKQSLADTPAPITVITRQQIHNLGITHIADALKLVPGMVVAPASGNEYRISYHGTNGIAPRRMQVLVDGMSIYRNSVSIVNWETIPVDILDVERIEVTRAPSGATYGTNAFLAVVNIITRKPINNQDAVVRLRATTQGQQDAYTKYANENGKTAFMVALHGAKTDGYDHLASNNLDVTQVSDGYDGLEQAQLNSRLTHTLTDNASLDMSLNIVAKTKDTLQGDSSGTNGSGAAIPAEETGTDIYFRSVMHYSVNDQHEFNIGFNYVVNENKNHTNACYTAYLLTPEMRALYLAYPNAALDFADNDNEIPVGTSAEETQMINAVLTAIGNMGATAAFQLTCGNINVDDKDTRTDFSFNDTYMISDTLRTVWGATFSQIDFESAYHINGHITQNRYSVFDNTEYKPDAAWTFNLGLLGEVENGYQDNKIFWSPRLAANYHLTANNTLRAAWSRSYRTPDLLERESNWQFTVTDLNPLLNGDDRAQLYFSALGNPDLLPEQIKKSELGYLGNLASKTVLIDASLYRETLSDVITSVVAPVFVQQGNSGDVILKGLDLNVIYNTTATTHLNGGYAYQDSNTIIATEQTLYARNAGFVMLSHELDDTMSVAGGVHTSSNLGGNRATNYNVTLNKQFFFSAATTLNTRVNIAYQNDKNTVVDLVDTRFTFSNDDQWLIMLEAGLHY